ncbi:TniQ family protein [Paenibacillus sp. DR312]|uniref:TniQ family protein n=1 Tax=Paenibacillus sp. DR312 TaxID=2871175 RepID=UPI001C98AE17|nr:TniQ family protein [Paenibacillus sp. DR312]QZN77681.1 TniQ family protein [Paenibacillus sp. DR312]
MRKLLIRLVPEVNESLHSFIGRSAEANSIPMKSLYTLLGMINNRCNYTVYGLEDKRVNQLSYVTGLKMNEINLMYETFEGYKSRERINHKFSLTQKYKVKFCPECFRQNSYFKKEWNLAPITICPDHNCKLVDFCMNCNSYIPLVRIFFKKCNCGLEFINFPQIVVSNEETTITRIMYSKMFEDSPKYQYPILNNPLTSINIHEILKVIAIMVNLYRVNDKSYPYNMLRSSRNSNEINHIIMIKFANLFNNWPYNFRSYLDEEIKRLKNPKNKLYIITRKLNEEVFDFIKHELNTCIAKWFRKDEIEFYKIKPLFYPFEFKLIENQIKDSKYILLNKTKVKVKNLDIITLKGTMQILKLNSKYVSQLIEFGIIESGMSENKRRVIKKSSVTSLLFKLNRKAIYPKICTPLIPIKECLRFLTDHTYRYENLKPTFADLIKRLLNGHLTLYLSKGDGLEKYCLSKRELKDWIEETLKLNFHREGLSLSRVSTILNLNPTDVRDLINKGFLASERFSNWRVAIKNESVQKFISKLSIKYVSNEQNSSWIALKDLRCFLWHVECEYSFINVISWIINSELTVVQFTNSISCKGFHLDEQELRELIRIKFIKMDNPVS